MTFRSWSGKLTTEETNGFLTRLAQAHLDRVSNSEIRDHLRLLLASGDYLGLCSFVLPVDSLSVEDLINTSQVLAFFQKRTDLDLGIDRRQVALDKFEASERACLESNDIFRRWSQGGFNFSPRVEQVLFSAQRKIARVLGDVPRFEDTHPRFGPGATTQLPRRMACAKLKLSQPLACSGDMAPLLSDALATVPHLLDFPEDCGTATVEIHCGKLVTVPKNAKTDRTVMIEPWLNSFFQLGVGQDITSKLRRVGVDLMDQSRNKGLARLGSLTGELATLDLSSASDTISVGLVEHLLPWDWYLLLSQLRTSIVEVNGTRITLQKFSSMGNGFTFPLESLIFWALASSAVGSERSVSVYGDDIIVPTHKVDAVIEALTACGFSLNREKSFWSGPFRESCGGDYLNGIDVRPCFIKDRMSGHDAFRLHNFYAKNLEQEFASAVVDVVDPCIRLYGPEGYGDGHLVDMTGTNYPRTFSKRITSRGWGGHLFDTWTYNRKFFKRPVPGDRILPAYTIYMREPSNATSQDVLSNECYDPSDFEALLKRRVSKGQSFEGDVPVDYLAGTGGCRRITIYTLGQ